MRHLIGFMEYDYIRAPKTVIFVPASIAATVGHTVRYVLV